MLTAFLVSFGVIFVADGLTIVVGRLLGARLPERAIRVGAAVSFFVFAVIMLLGAI